MSSKVIVMVEGAAPVMSHTRRDPTLSCVFDMNLSCKVQLWLVTQNAAISDKFAMARTSQRGVDLNPLAEFSDLMNSTIDSANQSMSATALAAFCQVCIKRTIFERSYKLVGEEKTFKVGDKVGILSEIVTVTKIETKYGKTVLYHKDSVSGLELFVYVDKVVKVEQE